MSKRKIASARVLVDKPRKDKFNAQPKYDKDILFLYYAYRQYDFLTSRFSNKSTKMVKSLNLVLSMIVMEGLRWLLLCFHYFDSYFRFAF